MKPFVKPLALTVLILWASACAVNPVTGKKQISFLSETQEIAMGAESDPQIIAQFGLYENEALQAYIAEKGQEMAAISHRPDLDFTFRVLDSDVVNAFAVPGGYVYFTRGILAHFNNEAQFAGVLGHEIGHITARHSAQQYTRQMLAQIAVMGGMIASERFRGFAQEAMMGMELLFLKFSRTHESESDVLGVYYSTQTGYDAHEMAGFFRTLDRMSGSGEGRLPEFLSTHPDPGRRYETVHRLAEEYQEGVETPLKVNRDGYLDLIDGIVYGPDPRQGYTDGNVFYHPELKFEYPYPQGWKLQNSPQQVQMSPEDGSALIALMLAEGDNAAQAATTIREKYRLQNVQGSNIQVNGLSAYKMVADYPQQDPYSGEVSNLAMQVVTIAYGGNVYAFFGLSEKTAFNTFAPHFNRTMTGFKALNDPVRINVKPERLRIVSVPSATTLGQELARRGVPENRREELAILNGMELSTALKGGERVKVVE